MAKNEFPLSVPPRWAAELFSGLSRIVTLEMKSEKLAMAPPTNLDVDCKTYVESVLANLESDAIRSSRHVEHFPRQRRGVSSGLLWKSTGVSGY